MTRRVLAAVLVLALGTAAAAYAATHGADDETYLVRAVFDNASFVIPGEDVKVAGVEVGVIDALDLTEDNKAVVVLRIDDPAFKPFRSDARCRVGLMSLIGEQFIECEPTQPSADGEALPPELPAIEDGPGEGQHLLDVEHTVTPVGIDLINNIMRLPQQERLRLIINELGAGLAGNGEALNAAIKRADPALQQADELVQVLAEQDELLGQLVDQSDAVLAPLAERREALGGFIEHAGDTAAATAAEGEALEAGLAKLPAFLRELKPAAERFGALAGEMEPGVRSLADQAPDVNAAIARFGPFSAAALPALESLGDVAERGRTTFPEVEPLVDDLIALGKPLRPLATNLAALGTSFDEAGGIEELMRTIYFYTGSINGVDELGPLRARRLRREPVRRPRVRAGAGLRGDVRLHRGIVRRRGEHDRAARLPVRPWRGGGAVNPRPRRSSAIAANPVLIGAATVLVVLVAVFLSYNANNGLPFVPTYELTAEVPNASGLIKGNEVRIGGARVGVVSAIDAFARPDGSTGARLHLKLEAAQPELPEDSTILVRPRSPLGLKYVEITRGKARDTFATGATIPLEAAATEPVELDEFFGMFDEPTREGNADSLIEWGNAFAGRGDDLNRALRGLGPLLDHLEPALANLVAPETAFHDLFPAFQQAAAEVAPVALAQADLFDGLDRTFAALSAASDSLQAAIEGGPPALDVATRELPAQAEFVEESTVLFAKLQPGSARSRAPLPGSRRRSGRASRRCAARPR